MALVGIVDTVLKQPISTVVATQGVAGLASGVSAIVYARGIADWLVQYELCYAIEEIATRLAS